MLETKRKYWNLLILDLIVPFIVGNHCPEKVKKSLPEMFCK